MNVYDFDKTIFKKDSTSEFCKFCMKRHWRVILHAPAVGIAALKLGQKAYTKDEFKTVLYSFLKIIPDIDTEVKLFWEGHKYLLNDWYLKQKQNTDLIISASPVFLLEGLCNELGVNLIASPVDKKTGKLLGPNNSGEAKVVRFYESYPGVVPENFYSDSDDDLPMARISKRAFKVINAVPTDWDVN